MCRRPLKRPFLIRTGPFLDLLPFTCRDPYGQTAYVELGSPYGKAPYKARLSLTKCPCRAFPTKKKPFLIRVGPGCSALSGTFYWQTAYGETSGPPLTGAGPLREAPWTLQGGTLPELGGNFGLCAVDQK